MGRPRPYHTGDAAAPSSTALPVSAFARPELVAAPEWLADQLGRHDLRILDVRWRPDGSGAAAFAAGHIPGAAHVDWREELIEPDGAESGPGLRLAGPERGAAPVGP